MEICPTCGRSHTEYLWVYQQRYYCDEVCVPGTAKWMAKQRPRVMEVRRGDSN